MKKQYQINKQRAAKQFEDWAIANESPIQLTFPTLEIAELANPAWEICCEPLASSSSKL